MCFSASASFLTAAVTGAAGIASLRLARQRREIPVAAMPLFFALQQSIEGALWILLPQTPPPSLCGPLTYGFLTFAFVFWPVFAPFAAYCVEDDARRKRAIALCLLTGCCVSAYLADVLWGGQADARMSGLHIVYESAPPPDPRIGIPYLVATGLALALSSHRALNVLSLIIVAGNVFAWVAYWEAFVSVWCFFAAAASGVIFMHFARQPLAARVDGVDP